MNHNNLSIKIALDTQILAYLVDETYPKLTLFIKTLSDNPFVDLVCSRFAIYEFIGIRKLEHYLRSIIEETTMNGSPANFSSILKNKKEFDAAELNYFEVYNDIKNVIEAELELIYSNFGISYENINIHDKLWSPHKDLVLSTKISKEDSLLLLSCVFPDTMRKEDYLIFLTNDAQFCDSMTNIDAVDIIEEVFKHNGLMKPEIFNLRNLKLQNGGPVNNLVDLKKELNKEDLKDFTGKFIIEKILNKYKSILLGEVINCACGKKLKDKLLCFKLNKDQELVENMYITILTQNFDLYHHPVKLSTFKCYGEIILPYKSNDDPRSQEISIELLNQDGGYLDKELMRRITFAGNLVFIHPDSYV